MLETRYNEKSVEHAALVRSYEELRDENTRSLNRVKERSETTRHYLQTQLADLEKQMITCRAQGRGYQKERDEVSITRPNERNYHEMRVVFYVNISAITYILDLPTPPAKCMSVL